MKQKMTRKLYLVLALLTGWCFCAQAQSTIALKLINYTIQSDSLNFDLGYTITINADLTNTGQIPYSDSLDFGLRNSSNSFIPESSGLFNKPPYINYGLITIDTGETVPAVFSVHIDMPYFHPGPDVVVVWPICSSAYNDSVLINLNILDPLAIDDKDEHLTPYIITGNEIFLEKAIENNFQQVRIFNISGQLLYGMHAEYIDRVPLAGLPHGLFFCELQTSDKRRQVIKFVR
ncbi:MAG: hypothetical protein U0V74_06505 [Chitinophagales bacterium]